MKSSSVSESRGFESEPSHDELISRVFSKKFLTALYRFTVDPGLEISQKIFFLL